MTGVQTCALPIYLNHKHVFSSVFGKQNLSEVSLEGVKEKIEKHVDRSEERRVGKSVDLGGRRIIKKKTNRKLPLIQSFTSPLLRPTLRPS